MRTFVSSSYKNGRMTKPGMSKLGLMQIEAENSAGLQTPRIAKHFRETLLNKS
jgi:hypothetical protein